MATGNKRRFPFLILFLAMVLASGAVLACSVPVFRYALERWEPSPYVLMVFHRGPMAPADKEPVELIVKGSFDGGGAVLMVTHSAEVAHRAHRTIRLEAGSILSGNTSAV